MSTVIEKDMVLEGPLWPEPVRVLSVDQIAERFWANSDRPTRLARDRLAKLERAGLLTKRRNGREQLAHGEVDVVRSVASMLTELEDVWRGRIARIDELLAEDRPTEPPE